MKQDAVMRGASRGCTNYKLHNLEQWLSYPKGLQVDGKMGLLALDQKQEWRINSDPYWQREIDEFLYYPGPDSIPGNFAVRLGHEQYKAIPYRVAAPMAWEYPYAYGQVQESITD